MKRYIFLVVICLGLSGCLAKKTTAPAYYELGGNLQACQSLDLAKKELYIYPVDASSSVDNRNIIEQVNGEIHYLNNAKFIALPSQMTQNYLTMAFNSSCKFDTKLVMSSSSLKLKTSINSLKIIDNQAVVALSYELFDAKKSLKSGIISKSVTINQFASSAEKFNALNEAFKQSISEMVGLI